MPNLKVNFDPANMLLYDKGDPLRAVEILGPDIRSVHVKDANRTKVPGTWGEEVPLGQGQVNIKAVHPDAEEGRLPRPPVHRTRGRRSGSPDTRTWPTAFAICANAWLRRMMKNGLASRAP